VPAPVPQFGAQKNAECDSPSEIGFKLEAVQSRLRFVATK